MMQNDFTFIYGPPGSGKSALGGDLAQGWGLPFYDLDALIEAEAGCSIPEIFAGEGEDGFRDRETVALQWALKQAPGVVALGGGALLRPENRSRAEAGGRVLCLQTGFETILQRMANAAGQRPLLDGDMQAQLQQLLEARAPHYASFPLRLDTTHLSRDAAVRQAQVVLGRFHITGMGAAYDVLIRAGGLDRMGEELRRRGLRGPIALVSDSNLADLHAARLAQALQSTGFAVHTLIIPAGEASKTIAVIGQLWEGFLAAGLERGSTVVALGGGVVGDLAGFAAATYLRGVAWVAAPTSLLAMVDAALGGKTGADLPQGKNLIGAFHPPRLVLVDPDLLDTLPLVELRNGLAEVVKHGVLDDADLFDLCRRGIAAVQAQRMDIVSRAVAVKVQVILADPFERGRRASLNLGHTLGHAIEIASDFSVRHGEAVAIGMVHAARLSERRGLAEAGLADEIKAVLDTLGLPTQMPPGPDRARLVAAMAVDKKRSGGRVRLVLPVRVGEVRWDLPPADPVELLD